MLTSPESANWKMPLLTWRNNISICLLNNYYVNQLDDVNDGFIWPDWLQQEPAVMERDNKCSTYYSYTPSSHQARTTSPPTLVTPIRFQQAQLRSFYLPKQLPTIPKEEPPWVADIYRLSLPSVWHYLSNYNSAPMRPAALNACVSSQ